MDDVRWLWTSERICEHLELNSDRERVDAIGRAGWTLGGRTTMHGGGPLQYVLRAVAPGRASVQSRPAASLELALHDLLSGLAGQFGADPYRTT